MAFFIVFISLALSVYCGAEVIGSGNNGLIVPPAQPVGGGVTGGINGGITGGINGGITSGINGGITGGQSNPCGIENWVQTPFQTCVRVIDNAPISWFDARKQCQSAGADLLVMADRQKASWYAQFLGQFHREKAYWLGAKYEQQGPRGPGLYWQTANGPIPFTFAAFSRGEPNLLYTQKNAQPCVLIGANLMWYDDSCTMQHPQVGTMCEKSLAGAPVVGGSNPVNQWGGSNPTNPVNPVNQWGGSNPTNPVNPVNQWGGSNPTNPVNPVNQWGGSNPTNPVNQWGGSNPTNPVNQWG